MAPVSGIIPPEGAAVWWDWECPLGCDCRGGYYVDEESALRRLVAHLEDCDRRDIDGVYAAAKARLAELTAKEG